MAIGLVMLLWNLRDVAVDHVQLRSLLPACTSVLTSGFPCNHHQWMMLVTQSFKTNNTCHFSYPFYQKQQCWSICCLAMYVDALVTNKQINVKEYLFSTNRSIKAWSEHMTSKYNSCPQRIVGAEVVYRSPQSGWASWRVWMMEMAWLTNEMEADASLIDPLVRLISNLHAAS
jgi:hypothetical protein